MPGSKTSLHLHLDNEIIVIRAKAMPDAYGVTAAIQIGLAPNRPFTLEDNPTLLPVTFDLFVTGTPDEAIEQVIDPLIAQLTEARAALLREALRKAGAF